MVADGSLFVPYWPVLDDSDVRVVRCAVGADLGDVARAVVQDWMDCMGLDDGPVALAFQVDKSSNLCAPSEHIINPDDDAWQDAASEWARNH